MYWLRFIYVQKSSIIYLYRSFCSSLYPHINEQRDRKRERERENMIFITGCITNVRAIFLSLISTQTNDWIGQIWFILSVRIYRKYKTKEKFVWNTWIFSSFFVIIDMCCSRKYVRIDITYCDVRTCSFFPILDFNQQIMFYLHQQQQDKYQTFLCSLFSLSSI